MYPHLQPGYTIRRPIENDIPAIIAVLRAFDIAETGVTDAYSQEDILLDLGEAGSCTRHLGGYVT